MDSSARYLAMEELYIPRPDLELEQQLGVQEEDEARRLSAIPEGEGEGGYDDCGPASPLADLPAEGEDLETSERTEGQGEGKRLTRGEAVTSLTDLALTRERTPSPPPPDPWAPLDPFGSHSTPRPIKKGRIVKLPPSIVRKHAEAKGRPTPPPPLPPIQVLILMVYTCNS